MKKLLILLCFLSLAVPPGAQTASNNAEVSARLAQAAEKYFDGKPRQALEDYIEISKQTQSKDAFLNAAFIALEQGNPKQAVDITTAGYVLYPQDDDLTEFTAEAYLADGQYENAEKFFSLLQPDRERAEFLLINLARTQLGMGETKLAKRNLQRAAAGTSHVSLANYLLGQIYEQEKRWGRAAKAYFNALEYDHQFMEARIRYAAALERNKQYNEAYKQYRILHTTLPAEQTYSLALQRLKPKLTKTTKELDSHKQVETHSTPSTPFSLSVIEQAPQMVRIGLGTATGGRPSKRDSVVFVPSADFTVTLKNSGKVLAKGKAKETWSVELQNGKATLVSPKAAHYPFSNGILITMHPAANQHPTILIKKIMSGAGMTWASVDDKEYRGKLEILHNKKYNTLVPINVLNMEEYLLGVLSSEMPVQFPMDAQRAQAVLARTYALKHLHKHKAYGYDLCDSQNCQVYGGILAETETGSAAVELTLGQVLLYKNEPIEGVFSANCGGVTQSSKDAGWSTTPYLNSVSDYKSFDFDQLQPYHFKELLQHRQDAYSRYSSYVSPAAYRWTRVIGQAELSKLIKQRKKDIGAITAIIPQKRGRSGYVTQVLVKGTKGSVTLSKENVIRNNLAPGMLRSSYFIVVPNYESRKLKNFVFYGGGWGHGVGFCQTGSAGRAEAGQSYDKILEHYFPGTELKDIYQQ